MDTWRPLLDPIEREVQLPKILNALEEAYASGVCYPKRAQLFRAFELTPLDRLKVVLVGQDPYHGPGQANGLSFSVDPGVKLPPSLKNLFKELESDLGIKKESGDLQSWATQGVLLLNAVLSVREGQPGSHQKLGWERFTDRVLYEISAQKEQLVFVLLGAYAQKKRSLIDASKHLILESAHPSPLSAYRGFFGSALFSKINAHLESHALEPVAW